MMFPLSKSFVQRERFHDNLTADCEGILHSHLPVHITWASLVAQTVKNLPAMWETRVRFLGREDPLEKEMAAHSSVLAWRIPMDRGAWQATVHGAAKSRTLLSY